MAVFHYGLGHHVRHVIRNRAVKYTFELVSRFVIDEVDLRILVHGADDTRTQSAVKHRLRTETCHQTVAYEAVAELYVVYIHSSRQFAGRYDFHPVVEDEQTDSGWFQIVAMDECILQDFFQGDL